MDYDKKISFFVFVCFNKMISRAKTAEIKNCFIGADVFAAFQCMEVKFIGKAVCFGAYCKSGWDRFSYYGIKLLTFDFFALNPGKCHSTANIYANKIWNDFFANCHSQTDSSDFSRMNVGHYPDLTAAGTFLVTNHLKLGAGILVNCCCSVFGCINLGRSIGTIDNFHNFKFLFIHNFHFFKVQYIINLGKNH